MFWLSLFLVVISSYLILSAINKNKENSSGFLYFWLIAFSQIVLSFEVLSLFKAISTNGLLICNTVFFILSIIIFTLKGKTLYIPNVKEELDKIKYALKRDGALKFLSVCFCLYLLFQIIRLFQFPVLFGDALTYYLPRCTTWIQQGSINHFITPDTRELIMPVNMEFLYTWLILLRKTEIGVAIFSYIGFLGAIYTIYFFLKEVGFTVRRRLWSIFVFSSFSLIAVQMYTPCADMFIGALILSSVYLFLKATKHNDKLALYFSSLAYALAVGTKTTSIIAIPSVFVVLLIITYLYKKENLVKHILTFGGFFILNFLIFSSYNYFLNLIHFKNPVSCSEQLLLNKFRGGFKGWLSNLIKYCFAIFDTSGIKFLNGLNGFISYIQSLVLGIFGITEKNFTSPYFGRYFTFSSQLGMMSSVLGALGLFAFLPSIIKSITKVIKNKISKRNIIMASLTLSLILNLIIFARVMVFTSYNMRYILTFVVIASPIVVYSYIKRNKNLFKIFLCWLMFIYFVVVAHKMPVSFFISKENLKKNNINKIHFALTNSDELLIYEYLIDKKNTKIGLIIPQNKSPNYYIEKLKLSDIHMDKILIENIEEFNLSDYDYLVTSNYKISSTNIVSFKERIKNPEIYVNKCVYYDYRQATIYDTDKKPATVECTIPFEYIEAKGFKKVDNVKLEGYFILENKIKK